MWSHLFSSVSSVLSRFKTTTVLFLLCAVLGVGLSVLLQAWEQPVVAQITPQPPANEAPAVPDPVGTIDPIPARHQLGAELYLENCATCHIGVPPQVLPVQTWAQLLQDSEHYGVRIPPLVDPPRLLIWQYVRTFSRSLREDEITPYHVSQSRFFKALHPRVPLERKTTLSQCISCHPGANGYNFRQLTSEWDDAA